MAAAARQARVAAVEEADAERALWYSKKLITQGKSSLASERLRDLVKKHPDTKAAADSQKLLEKMGP
jgi:hypothetical protein